MNDINDHQKMADAHFIGTYSNILGTILFICASLFAILGVGHHVKYALSLWTFIKGGRDEKSHELFTELYHGGNATKLCYLGYVGYILTLILAIFMHIGGLPLWAFIFTILPIFIVLVPFKIIGSLHISAIITFLGWMFLI